MAREGREELENKATNVLVIRNQFLCTCICVLILSSCMVYASCGELSSLIKYDFQTEKL